MNMIKQFVHDRKDHTDEHERLNLTEKFNNDEHERLNMTESKNQNHNIMTTKL